MPHFSSLYTDRLELIPIYPALINNLFKNKSKEEIIKFFQSDEAGYEKLRNMHLGGLETYRISMFYFLLKHINSKKIIGECGFHTWNLAHQRAELFYFLYKEEDKRKAYMSETLTSVLTFGFNKINLHRIQALVAKENIASISLLEKFSFQKEGILRQDYIVDGNHEDSISYSLLKTEWNI